MTRETFKAARARILSEAESAGFGVRRTDTSGRALKVPSIAVDRPRTGSRRIYLKAQSAHSGCGRPCVSICSDIRGVSFATLLADVLESGGPVR